MHLHPPRWVRLLALATAIALAVATDAAPFATAAGAAPIAKAPTAYAGPAASDVTALGSHFAPPANPAKQNYKPVRAKFPGAAAASIALAAGGVRTPAAGTPVWASALDRTAAPANLSVAVYAPSAAAAAGINGVLFRVHPDRAGSVRIGLDYGTFAEAYGGNYGSRLRLLAYPECVVTSPQVEACRQARALSSTNATAQDTVSAPVAFAGSDIVFAAQADAGQEGGAGGNYAATDLKASGSWSGGGSTGSFGYSYPIAVPPAASQLAPTYSLSYSSASIDGQTASTQAQASWVGDGWDTPRSYIEQSFIPCADRPEGADAPTKTGDQCYDGPILQMSLNGSTNSLVWDAGAQTWKSEHDNGDVIKHVTTGGDNGSGTYNHDYWTVTERDGTTYWFGRNRLPGWTSGKPETKSVQSEPVYSAHSGDPCYSSSGFSSSVCTMAYRWNLDYVKDLHGNALAYYYKQDTNYYGEYNGAHDVSYVRDSYLDRIDYGFTDGNAYGTVANQIVFGTGDRCVSGTCQPLTSANKANWPDVPYDLICASGTNCTTDSPSMFSTVRLAKITTRQWSIAQNKYVDIDVYTLDHTIPPTGDGTSPTLWLSKITRTGSDTTGGGPAAPISTPPVQFTGIKLQNRVDTLTDGLPAYYRYRVSAITTETGSVIGATYALPDPCTAPVHITASANTSSCYPVSWTPPGYTVPFTDWFNKYMVTKVVQTDPTGGALPVTTSYSYLGGAAWHYDDNEVVKAKYRTYGQFRGYGDVKVYVGDGVNDRRSMSQTKYYRGMSKNNNTTMVSVTDSAGGVHEDIDELSGSPLEETQYLGDGGPVDSTSIHHYWVSPASGTRVRSGLASLTANWTAETVTYTRNSVTSGGTTTWQSSEVDNSYDANPSSATFGLLMHTYTHAVPAIAAYDRCVTNTYAAVNPAKNLVGLTAEVETDAVACGGFAEGNPPSVPTAQNSLAAPPSVNRPSEVISDERTFYDDAAWSTAYPQAAAPSIGDVTMTRKATGYSGGFTYQTMARSAYDSFGRKVAAYDANGNKSTTAYTMNAVGLLTSSTDTNALNQSTSQTFNTARGLTLTETDANGVGTIRQYDALGRATALWLHSRATSLPANFTFAYQVSNTGITASTTRKLNDENGYVTSTTLYDGLLRQRQQQSMTPAGGRIVSDTFYDSRGWKSATFNGWWDSGSTPSTTLVSPSGVNPVAAVYDEEFFSYDGLGRVVADAREQNGVVVSTTSTVYNGDRVTTIAPPGGVSQTEVIDPLGRQTELDSYLTPPAVNAAADQFTGISTVTGGTIRATTYAYDARGNRTSVRQGTGPSWANRYDMLNRPLNKTDPDGGTPTQDVVYDANGNVLQSTDARGKTVSFIYDKLNRKLAEYAAPTSAQSSSNQVAAWVYDNADNAVPGMTYPIGHLTASVAYAGGAAYTLQEKGFNVFGSALGITVKLPSAEGVLGKAYAFSHIYTATTGLLLKDTYPSAGGLPAETILHTYSGVLDLPNGLSGGYAQSTAYDAHGRVNQQIFGAAPNLGYVTNSYDQHSGRLLDQLVTRAVGTPQTVDEQAYKYDAAGNVVRQISTRLGSPATSETQCYTYDGLDELTGAWTAKDSCAATPAPGASAMVGDALGASAAYWTTWMVNNLGNRTNQVQHAFSGGPSADTTTAYTYDGNGANQPHTLTNTATTGGSTGSTSYRYDAVGNMTTRVAGQGNQTLTYDAADRLVGITGGTAGNSSYVYDADGAILLQKDPGKTTLYLPGEQIVLDTAAQTTSGTRYIALPGGGTAIRSTTKITYEFTDLHSTPTLYLDSDVQTPVWRMSSPYGGTRGTAVAAPDNHGFLNKPASDATGLTIVGARQYDPVIGRFITLDPVFQGDHPTELDGYSYAGNNPVTHSDPTGTYCMKVDGIVCASAVKTAVGQKKLKDQGRQDAHNAAVKRVRSLRMYGRPLTDVEFANMKTLYGYNGTKNFTLGDALDFWRCAYCSGMYWNGYKDKQGYYDKRNGGSADPVLGTPLNFYQQEMCAKMGGNKTACAGPVVDNTAIDVLSQIPGYGVPVAFGYAIYQLAHDRDPAAATGAAGNGASGIDEKYCSKCGYGQAIAALAGPALQGKNGKVLPNMLTPGTRITVDYRDGSTEIDSGMGVFGDTKRGHYEVLFPMPISVRNFIIGNPALADDFIAMGMLSSGEITGTKTK